MVDLVLQIGDFFDSNVINRVLLLHFFEDFLELNNIGVGLDVHIRRLYFLILFH